MTIQGISTNVNALLASTNKFDCILSGYPTNESDVTSYPAAIHYYADGEAQYATVSQNRRVYEYMVDIILVVPTTVSASTQFSQAYALIDEVINLFDQSIDLSSSTLSLSRACDIMRPAPGSLEPIETDTGKGLKMTIRLFCEADITFRSS